MDAILDKVEQEALNLPREERAFLADRLLNSLDGEVVLSEVDAAWVAEAERRVGLRRAGEAKTVAGPQVLRQARKRAGL